MEGKKINPVELHILLEKALSGLIVLRNMLQHTKMNVGVEAAISIMEQIHEFQQRNIGICGTCYSSIIQKCPTDAIVPQISRFPIESITLPCKQFQPLKIEISYK